MAEGIAPYVLAAFGGVSAMLLWLKVGSLFGFRDVAGAEFRWSYLVAGCLLAAVLALAAQALWGVLGSVSMRSAARPPLASELRLVWGAAAFPQVGAVIALLPLDLLIVGSDTFTSTRLTDPLSTGWAAVSIALSLSVAAWSFFLLYKGARVATDGGPAQGITGLVTALVAGGVAGGAAALVLKALAGASG